MLYSKKIQTIEDIAPLPCDCSIPSSGLIASTANKPTFNIDSIDLTASIKEKIKMPDLRLSEDAHNRVAILFVVPNDDGEEKPVNLIAVSVKWLCVHGVPIYPPTGEPMAYHGTYIIQ